MRLHLVEDARQRRAECIQFAEETVVRPVLACVLPEPFGGVQFWRVRGQLMHLQPIPVGGKPGPDIGVFMVGGVVLNQDGALTTVAAGQLFEESEIGGRIEDGVLTVVEARVPEFEWPRKSSRSCARPSRNGAEESKRYLWSAVRSQWLEIYRSMVRKPT